MRSEGSQKKRVLTLRPEIVANRKLPVNLREGDCWLFDREMQRVIPQTSLLELRDVRISSDGILLQAGRILPESFAFPVNRQNWKRRSVMKVLVSNYLFKRARKFSNNGLWVTDDWSRGYFHWLTDVLPRIMAVKDRLSDLVLLLPQSYQDLEFVLASLRPFNISNVEFIANSEVLVCDRILLPSHTAPSGHYNEELIRSVAELLTGCYGNQPAEHLGERIYVSRSSARKRKIDNETALLNILKEFDFEIVHTEDYSFEQQVNIASHARHLVSNHGAGLTNMLFMSNKSNVLELRHKTDNVNNCYFTLASALNLNYFYQSCEPVNSREPPHTANLVVDETRLRENLRLMLAG